MDERKLISIRLNRQLYKKLKILTVKENTTLQDYIYKIIEENVQQYEKQKGNIDV